MFCKIVNNEIPAYKLYEDEDFLAFFDISQATLGHTLVIPKKHFSDLLEADSETNSKILPVVKTVTNILKSKLNLEDFNVISNFGKRAGQTVFHYHIHIIPRYDHDDFEINFRPNPLTKAEFEDMMNKIKN
ncbi:MAG: HIT family protein [Bacilli bacterium]